MGATDLNVDLLLHRMQLISVLQARRMDVRDRDLEPWDFAEAARVLGAAGAHELAARVVQLEGLILYDDGYCDACGHPLAMLWEDGCTRYICPECQPESYADLWGDVEPEEPLTISGCPECGMRAPVDRAHAAGCQTGRSKVHSSDGNSSRDSDSGGRARHG
jgi:predicted RNA-binding Zn-ribbon protein involved in translation (DUF1610 family)